MQPDRHSPTRARCAAAVLAALVAASGARAAGPRPAPGPEDQTDLGQAVFVAFDIETTGFDPVQDRVVEIGAVKFKGTNVIAQKSWLINPGRSIPHWAERVHGITDAMVAGQPAFSRVHPEFLAFIAGTTLLAHNARFDLAFIRAEAERNQLAVPANEVIDSLRLFRTWFPEAGSHSLAALAQHLAIDDEGLHRAIADTVCLFRILQAGLARHGPLDTPVSLKKAAGGTLRF